MSAWSFARPVTIVAAAVVVLAACGPTGPAITAPGSPIVLATPPAVPSGAPDSLPSFALPPLNVDANLEAMLPDDLGGATVEKLSMSGADFLRDGGESAADFLAMLGKFGRSPVDLSVAFAGTGDVILVAYRINGVDANLFFEAFKSRLEGAGGTTVTDVSFGGKSVKKFDSTDDATIYLYPSGDVLFSTEDTDKPGFSAQDADELLNEAFSKLP